MKMAIGDVTISHSSVAHGAYLTVQPSGTNVLKLTCITAKKVSGGDYESDAELYDGTNSSTFWTADAVGSSILGMPFIDNTTYLRIYNVSGVAAYHGYTAIQVA